MEKVLDEKVNTVVKLCIGKFTKFYFDKTAMVEIVKCIVNADSGEIIKQDFIQNRIFSSKGGNEYEKLLSSIKDLGEDEYFKQLLDVVAAEMISNQSQAS